MQSKHLKHHSLSRSVVEFEAQDYGFLKMSLTLLLWVPMLTWDRHVKSSNFILKDVANSQYFLAFKVIFI